MMKTTLVCGLLGSGKTTFVRNILRNQAEQAEKTVVLVNDFGAAGIDGEVLSAGGIETVELPGGCVCCTLRQGLMETVMRISERFRPEHLVIEPSGLASPSGVLEALEALGIRPVTVVGIVDASEFIELYEGEFYGEFFREQIAASDLLLLNKTDLVDRDKADRAEAVLGDLNPGAVIFRTVRACLDQPLPAPRPRPRTGGGHGHILPFETLSAKLGGTTGHLAMRSLLHGMAGGSYGDVKRAKALVRTDRGHYRFDLSSGRVEETPFEKPVGESRLVVIGTGLRRADILKGIKGLSP
jgi:G3E family GTPase